MLTRPKPLVLLILDGFGYSLDPVNNAIAMANTPCWDALQKQYPMTLLECSGDSVGLPSDQMGNSEVGHVHIGMGRYVPQDLSKVNHAVKEGSFFKNTVLNRAVDQAIANDSALHILGLLSPGGVHSHEEQILAMIDLAAQKGLKKIYLHAFLDGRDVPPKSAAPSLALADAKFAEIGTGRIASLSGRFYSMDRDKRWDRVKLSYDLLMKGLGEHTAKSASEGLEAAYARDESDEFVATTTIVDDQGRAVCIEANDAVVFMNFRADRAREISQAITADDFNGFERNHPAHKGYFCTLTEYHADFPYDVAYPPTNLSNGLGEYLAKLGMTQLRIAETEKYAHVTFFLNGGVDAAFEGEDRILIPSPQVRTYDLKPEMSSEEVTDRLIDAIDSGKYDVIIGNYANCDMVGHTGVIDAAIQAVQAVDRSLQRIVDALNKVGGQLLLTADHGNIEQMVDETTQQAHTAHTTNLVPFVHVGGQRPLRSGGSLSDIAPTLLAVLGVAQPQEMTGCSLLESA